MRKAELEMARIEHEAKMEAFEKEEQRKQALFDQNMKIENVKLRCHNLKDNLLKKTVVFLQWARSVIICPNKIMSLYCYYCLSRFFTSTSTAHCSAIFLGRMLIFSPK